jgi:hypothetical protein
LELSWADANQPSLARESSGAGADTINTDWRAAPPGDEAMSQFIHAREYLNAGDIVVVNCTHQCNVLVMDDSSFQSYRSGGQVHYHGGFYKMLPARIGVPSSGHWNVVLDTQGAAARYGIGYVKH